MSEWVFVCRLDQLEDPGAREFSLDDNPATPPAFVVCKAGRVYAYINVCPHQGRFLNWKPDGFLTRDKTHIMCSAHGAIFEVETGLCVAGACPGRYLTALEVEVRDGEVMVSVNRN